MSLRRIVARSLRKMHGKVIRQLYTRPRLANPWHGELKMDIPLELFESISQDILQRTSFGQRYRETNTEIIFEISDVRKAKYLFREWIWMALRSTLLICIGNHMRPSTIKD